MLSMKIAIPCKFGILKDKSLHKHLNLSFVKDAFFSSQLFRNSKEYAVITCAFDLLFILNEIAINVPI